MKVRLMYPAQDFDAEAPLPWQADDLMQDLGLAPVLRAMSGGDKFLAEIATRALLLGAEAPEVIRYRQAVLQDCRRYPDVVREIYHLPIEALERKREQWLGIFSHHPSGILSSAVEMLAMYIDLLRRLRQIADAHGDDFASEGFRRFFAMIRAELDEPYFEEMEERLRTLKLRNGVLLSARLGAGNEGVDYTLRQPAQPAKPSLKQLFARRARSCGFTIPPRDNYGVRALEEIKNRGLDSVANAVAQSAEHIDNFFKRLRVELAFYIAALNLEARLEALGVPVAFPEPAPPEDRRLQARGLYDLGLALTVGKPVVSNDLDADGKSLLIITGANQGGKTTFLRSLGLAQLMMQAGMFVPAEAFHASVSMGLFTHYRREEDRALESGKFDEELGRIEAIVAHLRPHSMVLFNESFAATNEREGSEIARQIVMALLEAQVRVVFVTHLYDFAHTLYAQQREDTLFLRAERLPDGTRTFKIVPGEPLATSFGEDLYRQIFGDDAGR